jgi:indole-3-glycerol phosphate synthase
MSDFLKQIIEHKKKLNIEKAPFYANLKKQMSQSTYTRYRLFSRMISTPGQINLIAEIKKASPSKGLLRDDFDVLTIAKIYADHKAAAMSILTEEKFFIGNPQYVKKVSDAFKVPILAKDFFINEGQIYEARFNGASAILLIMAVLEDEAVRDLMDIAHGLDLDCLVEVHNQEELDRALDCDAEILGINNRDLRSFNVDMKTSEKLIPRIPNGKIVVAESGITKHDDVLRLKEIGAHAVLIGETFMREKDIGSKIKDIMGA